VRTLRILASDIGGSHLKASIVDAQGRMPAQKVEVNTPYPCPPHVMVAALVTLVPPLPTPRTIGILYALLHIDHLFIGAATP